MSDPVARTLEAACALAEWEMRGGRGRDDGSWGRHVDAVIAATKGIDLDGAWFSTDSLAAALVDPEVQRRMFDHGLEADERWLAKAIIKAAKEVERE